MLHKILLVGVGQACHKMSSMKLLVNGESSYVHT